MREILLTKNNKSVNIIRNKTGKNDFIKTILQLENSSKISLEVSPNSGFETDILNQSDSRFVSVTWLGNTHLEVPAKDHPAVVLAKKFAEGNYPVLLHLPGRNIRKERMLEILNHAKGAGIKNILALQGDWKHVLERDDQKCDFPYASDLVLFIKTHFPDSFCIGVAGYPKIHPHSRNLEDDMKYLKLKVSNGADFIITQADFEFDSLRNFSIKCKENGINVPILPGIFAIKSYEALINIAKCCQFEIPQEICDYLKRNRENEELVEKYGLDLAGNLIKNILKENELFSGAHIFTMNDMSEVQKLILRL